MNLTKKPPETKLWESETQESSVRLIAGEGIWISYLGRVVVKTAEAWVKLGWEQAASTLPDTQQSTNNAGGSGVKGSGDEVKDSPLAHAAPAEGPMLDGEWCMDAFWRVNPGRNATVPSLYLLDFAREVLRVHAARSTTRTTYGGAPQAQAAAGAELTAAPITLSATQERK